jgi:8-oxo-dGTP pyrophosphatase MutT (NUDIX family)
MCAKRSPPPRRRSEGRVMERIGSKTVYEGVIADVRVDEFRHEDGSTSEREVVVHPGAVAMIAHDERVLYMVRQPREAVGEEHLLELPAGKFDVEGESPLETGKRELAEEIGLQATEWRELKQIYTSPGFSDERVSIMVATGLSEAPSDADEDERIEIVEVPLDDLDAAIDECEDAKSLVGLMLFRKERRRAAS